MSGSHSHGKSLEGENDEEKSREVWGGGDFCWSAKVINRLYGLSTKSLRMMMMILDALFG